MDLDELPFDALRALHTSLAVPSGPGAPREALRAADVGFHVETHKKVEEEEFTPLVMDQAPAKPQGRVIVMSFGKVG